MMWVILNLRNLVQTAMHWQNRLFLTLESSSDFPFVFHDSLLLCCLQSKNHAVT